MSDARDFLNAAFLPILLTFVNGEITRLKLTRLLILRTAGKTLIAKKLLILLAQLFFPLLHHSKSVKIDSSTYKRTANFICFYKLVL